MRCRISNKACFYSSARWYKIAYCGVERVGKPDVPICICTNTRNVRAIILTTAGKSNCVMGCLTCAGRETTDGARKSIAYPYVVLSIYRDQVRPTLFTAVELIFS